MQRLCIATPDPDSVSETYVRQHVRLIAPGRTVVLYFGGEGRSISHLPHLRISGYSPSNPLKRYFHNIVNLIRYGYPGAVTGAAGDVAKRFLQEHQVGAVLAEFGPVGCALLPICRDMGIRLVVHFHGHDGTVMPKRWVIRHAYRRLNKYADAVVCASAYFRDILVRVGFTRDKIHIIPHGIEVEQFEKGAGKDPWLILAVGRFVAKKAPHLTIEAFERVVKEYPQARLEMIGDGPLMPLCQKLVAMKGLEGQVILHGAKSHDFVRRKLAQASVFVQHSVTAPNGDTESLGISLLEAMASRVPVVATRHNGFVETVIEGVTGFLVEEGDVEGMADQIIRLLRDEGLRKRIGEAGYQHVKEHHEAIKQVDRLRALLLQGEP